MLINCGGVYEPERMETALRHMHANIGEAERKLGKYDPLDENTDNIKLIIDIINLRHGHLVNLHHHVCVSVSPPRSHFAGLTGAQSTCTSQVYRVPPANRNRGTKKPCQETKWAWKSTQRANHRLMGTYMKYISRMWWKVTNMNQRMRNDQRDEKRVQTRTWVSVIPEKRN